MSIEDLEKEHSTLLSWIDSYLTGERANQLVKFYDKISEELVSAPVSYTNSLAGCHVGGYMQHVNKFVRASLNIAVVWKKMNKIGSEVSNASIVFCALNANLGRLVGIVEGDDTYVPYFIENEENWQIQRGNLYVVNPALSYQKPSHRSLFILQHEGIRCSLEEYKAIQLYNGLYEEGNESYFKSFNPSSHLGSQLPIILSQANQLISYQ